MSLVSQVSALASRVATEINSLRTEIAGRVPTTRAVNSGTGLSGGGNLTADRTLSVNYGTSAGTAAQGNDSRITGAVQSTRQVIAGTGLSGGGTLAADRTLAVTYGTTAGTAAQGNDTRIVNAVPNTRTVAGKPLSANVTLVASDVGAAPTSHTHVATTDLTATGTKDATTFLRGDNTWAVPAGGETPHVVKVADGLTTAQINTLIANSPDGTVLDLGPYERNMTAPIVITNGVRIVGSWTIVGTTIVGTRLNFTGVDTSSGAVQIQHDYVSIEGVFIVGDNKAANSIGWHIFGGSSDYTHGTRLIECGAANFDYGSRNGVYSDHTTYLMCKFSGNNHATSFVSNSHHDYDYISCYLEGNTHCSAHLVGDGATVNLTFMRCHLGFSQYGIWQDASVAGAGFAGMTLIDSPIESCSVQMMKIEYGGNINIQGGYWLWNGTPANPACYIKELNTGPFLMESVRLEPNTPNANSPAVVKIDAAAPGQEVRIWFRLAGFAQAEYSGTIPALINNRPTNRFYAYNSNKGLAWDANYTYIDTPNVDLRFRKSTDYSVIGRWWSAGNRFIMPEFGVGPTGDANGPAISAGDGAPSAALPNGSIYLRKNGDASTTVYMRVSGAWTALAPGGGGGGTPAFLMVNAGSNLSTSRPTADVVYWKFNAGVDPGPDGANVTNAQAGDLFYVAGA